MINFCFKEFSSFNGGQDILPSLPQQVNGRFLPYGPEAAATPGPGKSCAAPATHSTVKQYFPGIVKHLGCHFKS